MIYFSFKLLENSYHGEIKHYGGIGVRLPLVLPFEEKKENMFSLPCGGKARQIRLKWQL